MRLIDADALIAQIEKNICDPCKKRKEDYNGVRCRACQYGDEIDDIYDAPTVGEWIPCSERLPETLTTVLAFCEREVRFKHKKKNTSVKFAWCCSFWKEIGAGKAWTICGINQNDADKFKVVAWMPLPTPWKED